MKRHSRLRDAEMDLTFALGQLQSGNLVSAYLNSLVAVIHIGREMTESQHQTALLEVSRMLEAT